MKVLFFMPYSGIWQHTALEISVAKKLEEMGYKTTIVSCGEILKSPCLTMQSHGLTQISPQDNSREICRECTFHSTLIPTNKSRTHISLSDFIEESDYALVNELVEGFSKTDWPTWTYLGVPIGAYASYEVLLNHKIVNAHIPEHLWGTYLDSVRNCLLSLVAIKKILINNKFDYLFTYNRNYSTNKTASTFAERSGIKTISLTASGPMDDMYGRILMTHQDLQIATFNRSKSWEVVKNFPLHKSELKKVNDHLEAILQARSPWVYSTKFSGLTDAEIRKKLQIASDRRIVLLTLSSADEVFAARIINVLPSDFGTNLLFESQIDWIRYILDISPLLPQYHFVVRVHPREFPNKRESVLSSSAFELLDLAKNSSRANVTFNFPDDGISLYDFIRITDRLLTGNSSAAIEFAAHGIPVIAHNENNNTNLPSEILHTARNLREYFELLSKDSLTEYQLSHMRFAHRWIYFRNFRIASEVGFRHRRFKRRIISFAISRALKYEFIQRFVLALFIRGTKFLFPKYKGGVRLSQDIPTFRFEGKESGSEIAETAFLLRFLQHGRVFNHS